MPLCGKIGVAKSRRSDELSVVWRIRDVSSLFHGRSNWYHSQDFKFQDEHWHFKMEANSYKYNYPSEWVELYAVRHAGALPKTLSFTIEVKGPSGEGLKNETKKNFSNNDGSWHLGSFSVIPVWIRDDILTIECVMRSVGSDAATGVSPYQHASSQTESDIRELLVPANRSLDKQDASVQTDDGFKDAKTLNEGNQSSERRGVEELLKSLHRLLESKKECDVIIKVQDKEFPAHRIFLQARSSVFDAMFSHDTVEKQSGVVNMEDCDPETFPDFLEHVYTGSVEMISSRNVFCLYRASDKYDMDSLKQECSKFIKNNMTVASFCEAITLAIKHDDRALIESATEFFCINSIDIVKTVDWQTFLTENAIAGNELFIKLLTKQNDVFCAK